MTTEEFDVKVAEKEKRYLDGAEQVVKPIFYRRSPRQLNINNTEPGAMSIIPTPRALTLPEGSVRRDIR